MSTVVCKIAANAINGPSVWCADTAMANDAVVTKAGDCCGPVIVTLNN